MGNYIFHNGGRTYTFPPPPETGPSVITEVLTYKKKTEAQIANISNYNFSSLDDDSNSTRYTCIFSKFPDADSVEFRVERNGTLISEGSVGIGSISGKPPGFVVISGYPNRFLMALIGNEVYIYINMDNKTTLFAFIVDRNFGFISHVIIQAFNQIINYQSPPSTSSVSLTGTNNLTVQDTNKTNTINAISHRKNITQNHINQHYPKQRTPNKNNMQPRNDEDLSLVLLVQSDLLGSNLGEMVCVVRDNKSYPNGYGTACHDIATSDKNHQCNHQIINRKVQHLNGNDPNMSIVTNYSARPNLNKVLKCDAILLKNQTTKINRMYGNTGLTDDEFFDRILQYSTARYFLSGLIMGSIFKVKYLYGKYYNRFIKALQHSHFAKYTILFTTDEFGFLGFEKYFKWSADELCNGCCTNARCQNMCNKL